MSEPIVADYNKATVQDVHESIESNLWLADNYAAQGATGLDRECLRAAWTEYRRHSSIIDIYAGPELGTRLRETILARYPAGLERTIITAASMNVDPLTERVLAGSVTE